MHESTRLRGVAIASVFAVLSLALGGASCDKKSVAKPTDTGPSVPFEAPTAPPAGKATGDGSKPEAAAPTPTPTPAPAPTPASTAAAANHFNQLAEKLPSPCGKPESLKRTLESDRDCKRAPFARRFVERMISLDAPDDETTELYRNRFGQHDEPKFDFHDTPFVGTPNAPVVLVEFYDYACPVCKKTVPVLEDLIKQRGKDFVIYFKHYPIHKESMECAKASIAAQRQGKFREMYQKLFDNQGRQSRDELFGYAKEVGLDMAKFEKDFNDPNTTAKVNSDHQDGEKAKLQGTPTIYINGRPFMDALTVDALADWIDEELAVNR